MRSGRIAFGDRNDAGLREFVGDRAPRLLPVPDLPWSLAGVLCVGVVVDDSMHSASLDAALRGADVVVEPEPGRVAAFLEDVRRLGVTVWSPADGQARVSDWGPLLDALAAGATTEEAARRCHLSLRSAHRRLAVARSVLGVATTAAAVARWSGDDRPHR